MLIVSGALLVLALTAVQGKLPPYFKRCKQSGVALNECLTKNANQGWPDFVKGNPKYHITSMNPLKNISLHVNINNVLEGRIVEGTIAGMESIHFESIRLDLVKQRFDIKFTQPIFKVYGNYEVSGLLLGKSISGNGFENTTYFDGTFNYFFEYSLIPKNNRHIIHIEARGLWFDVENINFNLGNLFDGDAKLGAQMNKFMNDNWFLVHEFSKSGFGEAVGEIYTTILAQFFQKVPMEDLF